jgi:predicted ATPase with chaperone activity
MADDDSSNDVIMTSSCTTDKENSVAAAAAAAAKATQKAQPSSSSHATAYKAPWVEAYRPRSLDDVLGNEDTILRLRAIAKDGNVPNLILSGPPGTGAFHSFLRSFFPYILV